MKISKVIEYLISILTAAEIARQQNRPEVVELLLKTAAAILKERYPPVLHMLS